MWGRRVIGISGSLIWSKTLMEQTCNPCGLFRGSPEGPVSQIHSPHLHVWYSWDRFRSFKVFSDAKERLGCGKQREATAPIQFLVRSTPVVQWLSYSPLDPRFAGSMDFFQSRKILSMTSFGREVKPWVPCRRFTARKRTSTRN